MDADEMPRGKACCAVTAAPRGGRAILYATPNGDESRGWAYPAGVPVAVFWADCTGWAYVGIIGVYGYMTADNLRMMDAPTE